jgi:lysylphosphatidylglycerol synthetase-like protein (DUF2156 family)
MRHILKVIALFGLACLFAGIYGALHNQISYTVAPEYFHRFKFHQFSLGPDWHSRLGASLVGFRASWWMGIVIGIFIIPFGVFLYRHGEYFRCVVRAFLVVALTALGVGLSALAVAFFLIRPEHVERFRQDSPMTDNAAAFLRAAAMHNFSYLGGLLGIFTGIAYLAWQWYREKARKADAHKTRSLEEMSGRERK